MEKTVFGVNTAEVETQVRKLVEVYKSNGKNATLKEWGHKLIEDFDGYGFNDLVSKFLKVLFEAKNDELINRVLEEKNLDKWLDFEVAVCEFMKEYPYLKKRKLLFYVAKLAETWAVYNLPALQTVMDSIVEHMEDTAGYIDSCYAFEDYIDDIRDSSGYNQVPFFASYVSKYMLEYLKDIDLEILLFMNQVGEVNELDLDYLECVWKKFCHMETCEDILLNWYSDFICNAVKEVLTYKGL